MKIQVGRLCTGRTVCRFCRGKNRRRSYRV